MVYQQCGRVCPQRCDIDNEVDCSGGCVEGCFCPTGYVFSDRGCISCQIQGAYPSDFRYKQGHDNYVACKPWVLFLVALVLMFACVSIVTSLQYGAVELDAMVKYDVFLYLATACLRI